MIIKTLNEEYSKVIQPFSCVESPDAVSSLNSKQRRRVLLHSREMDDFIHNEALSEQKLGTSTTHLLLDDSVSELIAYISLSADAIRLEMEERKEEGMNYSMSPALKIVRLAVSTDHQGQGIGRTLIDFAVGVARKMREYFGIVFMTLDCYEHRVPLYEHFGFKRNQIQTSQREYDSPISMRANLIALAERLSHLKEN